MSYSAWKLTITDANTESVRIDTSLIYLASYLYERSVAIEIGTMFTMVPIEVEEVTP